MERTLTLKLNNLRDLQEKHPRLKEFFQWLEGETELFSKSVDNLLDMVNVMKREILCKDKKIKELEKEIKELKNASLTN